MFATHLDTFRMTLMYGIAFTDVGDVGDFSYFSAESGR